MVDLKELADKIAGAKLGEHLFEFVEGGNRLAMREVPLDYIRPELTLPERDAIVAALRGADGQAAPAPSPSES